MKIFNKNIRKREILFFMVLFILALPSIIAFVHPGFPTTDDGNWMIIRLSAFYEAFRGGQIPVRWLPRLNNGYGYPVANFLYPGFMYLGIPIAAFTSSFVMTVKMLFISSLLGSALGMYLWLRRKYDDTSSLLGSLAYLYAPYHLYDAVTRGSLGEVLVLAIIPFVFWAIDRRSIVLTSILLGLMLISHNTLSILFLPVIIIYTYFFTDQESYTNKWGGIILGCLLSAFFWVPALSDLSSTVFKSTIISDWNKYFASLEILGITLIFVLLPGLVYILRFRSGYLNKANREVLFFILLGIFSVILSSSLSYPVWKILPVSFIQFPFRVLSITIFTSAILCAWIITLIDKKILTAFAFIVLIFFSTFPFLFPKKYDNYPEGYYSTNQDTTTVRNEYMPKWVKTIHLTQPDSKIVSNNGSISDLQVKPTDYKFLISAEKDTSVKVSQVYFTGWTAKVDNSKVQINYTNPEGLIEIPVKRGRHSIHVYYTENSLHLLGDSITLISLGVVGYIGIFKRRKSK